MMKAMLAVCKHRPRSRSAGTQTLRVNYPDCLGRDLRLAVVGEVAVDLAFDIVELHVTKAGALPLGDQRHEEIAIPVEVFPRRGNGAVILACTPWLHARPSTPACPTVCLPEGPQQAGYRGSDR